jgi:pectate lyase
MKKRQAIGFFTGVITLGLVALGITQSPVLSQTAACDVETTHSIVDSWDEIYLAEVTLTNNSGEAVSGWSLEFEQPETQMVEHHWNADVGQSGDAVTAEAEAGHWNGIIAAGGGTASFSMLAPYDGTITEPSAFEFRSDSCDHTAEQLAAESAVYQAEDAVLNGDVRVASNHDGFSGSGFVNFPMNGGAITYEEVDGGDGGDQTLRLRVAHGKLESRTGSLVVNGDTQPITFETTGSWSAWVDVDVTVALDPGPVNTIRLESTGQDLANQDQLTVLSGEPTAPDPSTTTTVMPPSSTTETTATPPPSTTETTTVQPPSTTATSLLPADEGSIVPDGFAAAAGTTGGGDAAAVTVSSTSAFKDAVSGDSPAVIIVDGRLDLGGSVSIGSNKTVLGADENAGLYGGTVQVRGENYIFKNLTFGPSSGDVMEVSGGEKVYITKSTFHDSTDELLSIVRQSDYVTISWSKFYFDDPDSHSYAHLIGNSDNATEDRGKLHVTLHHNWYTTGVRGRAPRVRFGEVHIYNNYHDTPGNGYVIGVGREANIRVENTHFDGVNDPWADYGGSDDGQIGWADLLFEGTSQPTFMPNSYPVFSVPYTYDPDPVENVESIVKAGAGNVFD